MKKYKVNGRVMSLSGWADRLGMSRASMSKRIRKLESDKSLAPDELERRIAHELQRPLSQGRRTDTNATSSK